MYVKKKRKKCSVRGCKNVADVYLISKSKEMGGSIFICTECLKEATESIKAYTEPEKVAREDKPLFPHPELAVTTSSVAEEVKPEPTEVIVEETTEDNTVSVAEDSVTYKADTSATTKSKQKSNNKSKR